MIKSLLFGLLLALASIAQAADPAPNAALSIAAASDLKFAMDDLIRAFQQAHPGPETRTIFGSSGSLAAQIENGAPFDVFLAADSMYTEALAKKDAALDGRVFEYGLGHLTLWSRVEGVRELKDLADPRYASKIRKIAIANPEHAPYGRAAVAALQAAGIHESVKAKLVYGENVAQAAQYVQSGAAEAGLLSLSLLRGLKSKPEGVVLPVDDKLAPPLRQSGILVKRTRQPARAQAFEKFLLSEAGREILSRFGIQPPGRGK